MNRKIEIRKGILYNGNGVQIGCNLGLVEDGKVRSASRLEVLKILEKGNRD